MLKILLAAATLWLAADPALAQAPKAPAAAPAGYAPLTVDSTLHDLISDPRTRPVMARRMPGFIERFETDPEMQQMFGDASLSDLLHDPHIRGLTPEALAKIGAELAEAQKPPAA
ncbi:MAG TPA: hypothetical protein VGC92_11125 [Phenylobacterium sp.]|jgi:hypothetical protein